MIDSSISSNTLETLLQNPVLEWLIISLWFSRIGANIVFILIMIRELIGNCLANFNFVETRSIEPRVMEKMWRFIARITSIYD